MICDPCKAAADFDRNGGPLIKITRCPDCGRIVSEAQPNSEKRAYHKKVIAYRKPPAGNSAPKPVTAKCKGSGKRMFTRPSHCTDPGCPCHHRPIGSIKFDTKGN